ncbi:MAG: Hsp20/alpha crystallin family protein [Cyanobacteriota bacterium]|nr:Hsp20/alpha crystallin family protein [Cyanobacteriota bacterium]MDY6359435.1 Hsp20/alpha crystallin family protein [Cyanobacteriota bacterium]MDY6382623.1 Hsp20/alpha crystallin family protein [Cyanobacteriota bacterium]
MRFLVRQTPDNFIKSVNDEICSILNRHFDDMYPDYTSASDAMTMPIEVSDKKNEYDIRAELPGVKKEDLDIDLNDNYLTIRAKKTEEKEEGDKSYKKSEFRYGEFSRSVYLPQDVDVDKIDAKLEHGVLKIVAPKIKSDNESVKKITVK